MHSIPLRSTANELKMVFAAAWCETEFPRVLISHSYIKFFIGQRRNECTKMCAQCTTMNNVVVTVLSEVMFHGSCTRFERVYFVDRNSTLLACKFHILHTVHLIGCYETFVKFRNEIPRQWANSLIFAWANLWNRMR